MAETLPAPDDFVPSKKPFNTVLQGGLATTFITLATLYLLSRWQFDFNPMGWYADYVIPIGALAVGLAAGSGYGLISWLRGVRVNRHMLGIIVVIQLLAYFAAEYIEYRDVTARIAQIAGTEGINYVPISFVRYYRLKAETFAWKADHGEGSGGALGYWGYLFVGLGVVGFVGGGLIAPAICMKQPYCEGCQRYMRTKMIGLIPACGPTVKVKKHDIRGQEIAAKELESAQRLAEDHMQQLRAATAADDAEAFRQIAGVAFGHPATVNKLPARIQIDLVQCPSCAGGWINQSAVIGKGDKVQRQVLDKAFVSPAFATAVRKPVTLANTSAPASA